MPYVEIVWTDGPDGNIGHLAQYGVWPEKVNEVLTNPTFNDGSRSSGLPIAFGYTSQG